MQDTQAKEINLSEEERKELEKLARRHSTPQQIALRARIILLASEGQNHSQIAQNLGISRQMAALGVDGLNEKHKK